MAKYYVNRSTRSVINIGQTWSQKSLEFQSTRAAILPRQKIFCELYALIFNLIMPPTEGPSILGHSAYFNGQNGTENARKYEPEGSNT